MFLLPDAVLNPMSCSIRDLWHLSWEQMYRKHWRACNGMSRGLVVSPWSMPNERTTSMARKTIRALSSVTNPLAGSMGWRTRTPKFYTKSPQVDRHISKGFLIDTEVEIPEGGDVQVGFSEIDSLRRYALLPGSYVPAITSCCIWWSS